VIVRHGAALEMLSRVTIAVFDKTGTLTIGKPSVKRVLPFGGHTERSLLMQAAAVEQGSSHLLAQVIVDEAKRRYGKLQSAKHHRETPGEGLTGVVGNHEVVVGSRAFVERHATELLSAFDTLEDTRPALRAYVLVGGKAAGVIEYADAIRPELPAFLASLAALGVNRTVLLSGDRTANARAVGNEVGISEAYGELMPADKATLVSRFRARGEVVMMVGDGTNDAPALAAADVGVALAGHGGGISSEAADVVVLIDDLSRAGDAIGIGQRTMRIARQSIIVGLTLSGVAMVFAAFGFIQPTEGALLQEGIDVAVILNALRASGQ
jgi:P-type E1-E2 ATPase